MQTNPKVLTGLEKIYRWIDSQNQKAGATCGACGRCCNFETYGHQLFVTPPELMYLAANLRRQNLRAMTNSICPYNVAAKCTIHNYRFAACRIFFCKADRPLQNQLSESVLRKIKALCRQFNIPYRYTDLRAVLNASIFADAGPSNDNTAQLPTLQTSQRRQPIS